MYKNTSDGNKLMKKNSLVVRTCLLLSVKPAPDLATVANPGFPVGGGANIKGEGRQPYILRIFSKLS